MIAPINCPKCNVELLNTFENKRDGEVLFKDCKNANHVFKCRLQKDEVFFITINVGKYHVEWDFVTQTISIYKPPKVNTQLELPWFEPNLTDYPALVKKIRKYIALS